MCHRPKIPEVHIRHVSASRVDDLKREIEDSRDQRARIYYTIELHMAELHALEAEEVAEEKGGEVLEVRPAQGGGSNVRQLVKCGKDHCRCAKPGGDLHGPYWYLFTKAAGRRIRNT
jgi:hypothetical protein